MFESSRVQIGNLGPVCEEWVSQEDSRKENQKLYWGIMSNSKKCLSSIVSPVYHVQHVHAPSCSVRVAACSSVRCPDSNEGQAKSRWLCITSTPESQHPTRYPQKGCSRPATYSPMSTPLLPLPLQPQPLSLVS